MTVPVVEERSALEAWRAGVRLLLESGNPLDNLITTILDPSSIDSAWLTDLSPHRYLADGDNIRDVVNTIFPRKLVERMPCRAEMYSAYLKRHDRAHRWRRGRHAWGTYFERLIRFPTNGNSQVDVNQLERVIGKLRSWSHRSTTGLVFHLSSPVLDSPRTRGGPCWHYAELLWKPDNSIDLVAVYRNHDFYNKVLGNYIGLGLLLKFICDESDKIIGKVICHSVHAYFDNTARQALANMVCKQCS